MVFKSLIIKTSIRLVLILFVLTSCAWFIANSNNYAVIAILLMVGVLLVWELWRSLTLTNRLLSRFFTAVRYDDFSQRFNQKNLGTAFDELENSMNLVIKKLQTSKQLLEQQSLYLQTILQHVETAVLVYDSNGKVSLFNRAAKRLLQTNNLTNIAQLETDYQELSHLLVSIRSGQRNLCSCDINNQPHQLLVDMVEARIENDSVYIAAIQDIQSELDEKELKAWRDITRVLTHEISNSITPITSLATTCHQLLNDSLDEEDIDDLREAIATIERRGENLVQFIANYRKLTQVPKLHSRRISVNQLIQHILSLFQSEFEEKAIKASIATDEPEIFAVIDPVLVEQVLVNLIKNALAAVKNSPQPQITIKTQTKRGRLKIEVIDNGRGILPDAKDRIFVPFYSTKPDGSGIGLSLSRLIMQLHKGTISVQSELDKGSNFVLVF